MQQTTGLTIVLFLVAVAILIQAGMTIAIWLALRTIPGKVEAARDNSKQRFDPLVQSVTGILTDAREPLRAITTNLAEISKMLRERTSDVDGAGSQTRGQITGAGHSHGPDGFRSSSEGRNQLGRRAARSAGANPGSFGHH